MSEYTAIEWCDHSWSPWDGCTKRSAGCANCYAETRNHRWGMDNFGKGNPRRLRAETGWREPLKWQRAFENAGGAHHVATKPTVFPSLCDWLDEEVPDRWLFDFLTLVLRKTPNLNWLLLTKRPELFEKRLRAAAAQCTIDPLDVTDLIYAWLEGTRIPLNVWPGASVEDQPNAWRIQELLKIPAAGRFLSLEPLLGPVELRGLCSNGLPASIDWLIIGGESGHGARPCNVEWIRSLVSQGKAAGVATFVKQLGAVACDDSRVDVGFALSRKGRGYLNQIPMTHPKGGDPAEWPEDLRVREFPEGLR